MNRPYCTYCNIPLAIYAQEGTYDSYFTYLVCNHCQRKYKEDYSLIEVKEFHNGDDAFPSGRNN